MFSPNEIVHYVGPTYLELLGRDLEVVESGPEYTLILAPHLNGTRYDLLNSDLYLSKGTQGLKHDSGKPQLSLVSRELKEAVARVREFGAKKYSRNNWQKGFKVTRSLDAAYRHIDSFNSGETNDPESGLCHLWHAVCSLEHAIFDMIHHPENDDRKSE